MATTYNRAEITGFLDTLKHELQYESFYWPDLLWKGKNNTPFEGLGVWVTSRDWDIKKIEERDIDGAGCECWVSYNDDPGTSLDDLKDGLGELGFNVGQTQCKECGDEFECPTDSARSVHCERCEQVLAFEGSAA